MVRATRIRWERRPHASSSLQRERTEEGAGAEPVTAYPVQEKAIAMMALSPEGSSTKADCSGRDMRGQRGQRVIWALGLTSPSVLISFSCFSVL